MSGRLWPPRPPFQDTISWTHPAAVAPAKRAVIAFISGQTMDENQQVPKEHLDPKQERVVHDPVRPEDVIATTRPCGDTRGLWSLLREHAAWLNVEKQIMWRRFAASVTAVSIYLTGSILARKELGSSAGRQLSVLGVVLCVVWLFQTNYGWTLQNRRLTIISQIQEAIPEALAARWSLAFIPGRPKGQRRDWVRIQATVVVVVFLIAFVVLIVACSAQPSGHLGEPETLYGHTESTDTHTLSGTASSRHR
jgi:hypothetical protein